MSEFYDRKNAACTPPHPPSAHLFCGSDNAANQAKNNYHFSWMIDYVEEDHGLQTIQQNLLASNMEKVVVQMLELFAFSFPFTIYQYQFGI